MSGAHIAIHAAQEQKKKQQEEEEMTTYTRQELENDFEFKILRSIGNKFKNRDIVEQVKAEEAMAGWIMVEKFDDGRIRFKRPLSTQKKDALLPPGIDPYRTRYGMSDGGQAAVILGILALLGGVIAILAYLFS